MNNIGDENLSEEYTCEKASTLSVKLWPGLTKNMSKNPLSWNKRKKDVFVWKEANKDDSSSFCSDQSDEPVYLPSKTAKSADISKLRRRSRSLTNNQEIKRLIKLTSQNKMNQDIKMLLQEAIKIRESSESDSAYKSESNTSSFSQSQRMIARSNEPEIRIIEDNTLRDNLCYQNAIDNERLVTVGDVSPYNSQV